ncbi:MAG: metallophosphoesterase [Flavobacteriaceae bacterium]|nr:metallophosphoesterase [Flavobacteriaceae bacterium]
MLHKTYKILTTLLLITLSYGCATHKTQINRSTVLFKNLNSSDTSPVLHRFYLIGDAGNSKEETPLAHFNDLQKQLANASKNSTVLFLGDNIYPGGMPPKTSIDRKLATHRLQVQIDLVKDFKGQTIFIPGNHDWYSNGSKGIWRQENYIKEQGNKNISFLPKNACPITKVKLNDAIDLLIIDSEWYIQSWDKDPKINDKCSIKTRRRFLEELESEINKSQNKTLIIAVHHPMFSNGPHGGEFSFKSHLKPLPILGSLKNLIRKTSGVSPADQSHWRYRDFVHQVSTLTLLHNRCILVSGHEHSLQYLTAANGNIKQIISGSGSKTSATKRSKNTLSFMGGETTYQGHYTSGNLGYAVLDIHENKKITVDFIDLTQKTNHKINIFKAQKTVKKLVFKSKTDFKKTIKTSILKPEAVVKSATYKFFWGDHYRHYYGLPFNAKVAWLDTLYGGLKVIKKGGGHQSNSLRLESKTGQQYAMRSLNKNTQKYLKSQLKGVAYSIDAWENTSANRILTDFFTTPHPFGTLSVGTMAGAIQVNYANTKLYYIPKQAVLGKHNNSYGNALYFIEERPSDGQQSFPGFGNPDGFINTNGLLKKIRKNSHHKINETAYVRARIFDMIIGDWDRHFDQWRWAIKKQEDGHKLYTPIPRDRDAAFAKFDGLVLNILIKLIPEMRFWQSYDGELKKSKWFMQEAYNLDKAILSRATVETWKTQAQYLQKHLSDEVIKKAFEQIPVEMQDSTITRIKRQLKERRKNIVKIATKFGSYLDKITIIRGTDKADRITVTRLNNGRTKVSITSLNSKDSTPFYHRIFHKKSTREIVIYGLNGKDHFIVEGSGRKAIKVRLLGGQNHDTYTINNKKKLSIFDFKSKKSTLNGTEKPRTVFTDLYATNTYHYRNVKNNTNQLFPYALFKSEEGVSIFVNNTYTVHGVNGNPFREQHAFKVMYNTNTIGFTLNYIGEFANIFPSWNLMIDALYTTPKFTINYLGDGNNSLKTVSGHKHKFYKTDIEMFRFNPKLRLRKQNEALLFTAGPYYEKKKVADNSTRFAHSGAPNVNKEVFKEQEFIGIESEFSYDNVNAQDFPTYGFHFWFKAGYKYSLNYTHTRVGYLKSKLGFDHKLTTKGNLVLSSIIGGEVNLSNDYLFYDAVSIGGSNGLRGFIDNRFSGNSAVYQNTDIRLKIARLKTSFIPFTIGLYGGFDYGRVWQQGEQSKKWHTSTGGGIWVSALSSLSLQMAVFNSSDGNLISIGLNFNY